MPTRLSRFAAQPGKQPVTSARRISPAQQTPLQPGGLAPQTLQRAVHAPDSLTQSDVLTLQRTLGNRAVQRMLQSGDSPDTGQNTGATGRLRVGPVHDRYEQQADAVAQQVTGGSPTKHPTKQGGGNPGALPKQVQLAGGPIAQRTEQAIFQAQGRGKSLETPIQRRMESTLGMNLQGVRVHTDARADRINRALSATASAYQKDIFFRKGAYQPQTRQGQQLLAHELTHVGQQTGQQASQQTGHNPTQSGPGPGIQPGIQRSGMQGSAMQGAPVIQRVINWTPESLVTWDADEPDEPARLPFGAALERDYWGNIVDLLKYYARLSPKEKVSDIGLSWLDALQRAILGWRASYEKFTHDGIIDYNPNVDSHMETLEIFGDLIDREIGQVANKRDSGLKGNTKLGQGAISEVLKVKSKWLRKAKVWKEESWAGNAGANPSGAANAPSAMGVNFWGSNLSGRSVAASDLDKALLGKSGVLGRTKFGARGGKFGQIQDFVKGSTLKSKSKDERTDLYNNWKVVRDLQHLQLMDFITGQVDRHDDNILITKSGITGIDSDFGFGAKKLTDLQPYQYNIYGIHNKGLPKFITKQFAKSIGKMTDEKLRNLLNNKIRDEEVDTAVEHLHAVKDAISNGDITVLDNKARAWNDKFAQIDKKKSYFYKGR